MSLRISQFFLCQSGEIHHQEVRQDLYKLLFEQNLEMQNPDFFLFKKWSYLQWKEHIVLWEVFLRLFLWKHFQQRNDQASHIKRNLLFQLSTRDSLTLLMSHPLMMTHRKRWDILTDPPKLTRHHSYSPKFTFRIFSQKLTEKNKKKP